MRKKRTQAMINKEEYLAKGEKIPTCVNQGCDKKVIVRDWKYYSFKHLCSDCNGRMKRGDSPRKGVTFYKKNYCENRDSRLGFKCPVSRKFGFIGLILHGDHKNGNHEDNRPENLQTLCSICHHLKGLNSGDFVSAKKGRRFT